MKTPTPQVHIESYYVSLKDVRIGTLGFRDPKTVKEGDPGVP